MSDLTRRVTAVLGGAVGAVVLAGCGSIPQAADGRDGEGAAPAIRALASRVASHPRDPDAHLALAAEWERAAAASGDDEYRELAAAGFRSAVRLAPEDYRANMLAGRAEFRAGRHDEALEAFAAAVVAAPDDAAATLALATAAYRAGDARLAALAAERAGALAPARTEPVRLLALSRAASGESVGAHAALDRLVELDAAAGDALRPRVTALLRTAALDAAPAGAVPVNAAPIGAASDTAAPAPSVRADGDQVSIDVAIILSQNSRRDRIGLNLLDGLRAQYAYSDTRQGTRLGDAASDQRTLTRAISTPVLNYNLNVFNQSGQFYQVVARPTLTAYRGETSEFFVGRTSNIPVSGVNFAQLERVDIGISMKVTPLEIDGERVKVRIETGRSFASNESAGTFAEALTVFRQNVVATAEVRFGESLVLSGLSESVDDAANTKTPGLGSIPVVGLAFNERSKLMRRDAALVLVTPSRLTRVPSQPWARGPAVERLARLWSTVIDPASNALDVAARLERTWLFRGARADDAPLYWRDGGGLRAFESLLLSTPL